MQALVLAAGWATRLGDLARGAPKHLLPIGDRYCIDFVFDRLEALPQLHRIHLITHDVHFPRFTSWSAARKGRVPVSLHSDGTDSEATKLGTIGDIQYFLTSVKPRDDLLIVAGDNLFDFDIGPVAERARRELAVGLFDVGSTALATRYGVVELDADGYIVSFEEKPSNPRSSLVATTIYGLPRAHLGDVQAYLDAGGEADKLGSLMEWLHTRRRVAGHVFRGRWFDVGSPDEYARAQAAFGHMAPTV